MSGSYSSYLWLGNKSGGGYVLSNSGTYNYKVILYSGSYNKEYSGTITVPNEDPFSGATIRSNVSTSKATSSSLPSGATSFKKGSTVFFNSSISGVTVTSAKLYITPPNGSESQIDSMSGSYDSYLWLGQGSGGYTLNQSGTYRYRVVLYSGSYSKEYSGSITVPAEDPFANASLNVRVSKTAATSSSLPSAAGTLYTGDKVYFNASISGVTITGARLYITPPGGSEAQVDSMNGSYTSHLWLGNGSSGYQLSQSGSYRYRVVLYSGSNSKEFSGTLSVNAKADDNPLNSANITIRVSTTAATSSNLPANSNSFTKGNKIYFNGSISGVTVTKAVLYITSPSGSESEADSINKNLTSYFWLGSGSTGYSVNQTGTYRYRVRLYAGNYYRDFSGSFTSADNGSAIAFSVSTSKVTSNNLPANSNSFTKGSVV